MKKFFFTICVLAAFTFSAQAVDKLYIVGPAVFTWDPNEALLMYSEGSDVFSFTGYFEADQEFKFLKQPAWGDEYCNGAGSTGYLSTSGTLTEDGTGDPKFMMQTAGYYKITCDLTNLTITAEAKTSNDEQPYLYQALYAVGSATFTSWTCGNAQRFEKQEGRLYSGDIYLFAGGTFKLTTAPSETFNDTRWWYYRDDSDAGKISSDATDDRQWSVSETGLYTVTVDLDTKTISIQKTDYSKLYVFGNAVFSGWDSGKAPMMNVESANIFTYIGWFAADQEFKFSTQRFLTNNGLQLQNGAGSTGYITGETGTLMPNVELNGDYKFMLAEAGNYKITCNLNTMTVTVEKIPYQAEQIQYSALYMVGTATPDNEDFNVFPSLAVKLHSNGDNTYSAQGIALTAGVFKLITANDLGWNTKNYFRDNSDEGKVSEDDTDDRKWTISEAGSYDVTVDLTNMTISIVKDLSSLKKPAQERKIEILAAGKNLFKVNNVENAAIHVFNIQGALLQTITAAKNGQLLDLNNASAGLYLIKITDGISSAVYKVIVN